MMRNNDTSLDALIFSQLENCRIAPLYLEEVTDLTLHCINNASRLDRHSKYYPDFFNAYWALNRIKQTNQSNEGYALFNKAFEKFETRTALLVLINDIYEDYWSQKSIDETLTDYYANLSDEKKQTEIAKKSPDERNLDEERESVIRKFKNLIE